MNEKMKILLAYDGSECSKEAIKDLKRAGAKTFDADCIFVGSRGANSRLERHTLGSISAAVANGAHCSVEIVHTRRPPRVTSFPG